MRPRRPSICMAMHTAKCQGSLSVATGEGTLVRSRSRRRDPGAGGSRGNLPIAWNTGRVKDHRQSLDSPIRPFSTQKCEYPEEASRPSAASARWDQRPSHCPAPARYWGWQLLVIAWVRSVPDHLRKSWNRVGVVSCHPRLSLFAVAGAPMSTVRERRVSSREAPIFSNRSRDY